MDKTKIAWTVSFAYIAYLFVGQIPFLKNLSAFSTLNVSLLLLVSYAISTVLLMGVKQSGKFFIIAGVVGSLLELLSLRTGIPFGNYYYTVGLGPLIGPIPIFIPLLWASLSFYAYEAGKNIAMPFLLVSLDLSFDPRFSGRLWVWTSSTQYFGDPWTNFVGWFVTATIISAIFYFFKIGRGSTDIRAILFIVLFGIDNCISDLYDKLVGPAIISFLIFLIILATYMLGRKSEKIGAFYSISNGKETI